MLELTTNIRTTGPLQLSLAVAGTKRPHCMAEFNPSLDMVQLEAKDPYRYQKMSFRRSLKLVFFVKLYLGLTPLMHAVDGRGLFINLKGGGCTNGT